MNPTGWVDLWESFREEIKGKGDTRDHSIEALRLGWGVPRERVHGDAGKCSSIYLEVPPGETLGRIGCIGGGEGNLEQAGVCGDIGQGIWGRGGQREGELDPVPSLDLCVSRAPQLRRMVRVSGLGRGELEKHRRPTEATLDYALFCVLQWMRSQSAVGGWKRNGEWSFLSLPSFPRAAPLTHGDGRRAV